MNVLPYAPDAHGAAVKRIWREVGWLDTNTQKERGFEALLGSGNGYVTLVNGEAECAVSTAPGNILHTGTELPLTAVTTVVCGQLARRQGIASRLAAYAIAQAAREGAAVTALGVFDQGYYERLGYGPCAYEHEVSFDPALLVVPAPAARPVRLTVDDAPAIHAARLARMRGHGSCNLAPVGITTADILFAENPSGLGFRSAATGLITHAMVMRTKSAAHGPYEVVISVYRNWGEMIDLLALLRELSDQVHLVRVREPVGFQMQDLMERPFRHMRITEDSKYESGVHAYAYAQARICDLAKCVEAARFNGPTVRFNLEVSDPIADLLADDSSWRGVGGSYMVTFGPESSARIGRDDHAPTLSATIGAFTRLWLGVLPATSLAVSDSLKGPASLLAELDRLLQLPRPSFDWDF
jgi:predicted acetyltransferase